MCGICGITWDDHELIKLMGNACKHRGPEQEGFYIDESISLCCERLRIQDLSEHAKQPIHNEDETIWVVLNGEIYNFQDLRNQLKDKHKFYTNSDTEVIVHAYEEYGEDFISKLNGMFAFAVYDVTKKKLLIFRDRLGVKPLFYTKNINGLLFSSEIKSILQHEEVKREINYDALNQFISYAYTIDGQTLIKSIKELLPGHKLIYDLATQEFCIKKYWQLQVKEESNTEDYFLKKLENIFENSIRERMVSDAPLGAFLSGGLDSSVMVAMMSKLNENPVRTFTTGFGHELDEYNEAKIVAEHCNTNHKEISLTFDELAKSMPTVLWHMEFPFGRPSILSNFLAAKEIKNYVTVAFTGEGSDECFGGYNRYLPWVKINPKISELSNSISSGFFKDEKTVKEIFNNKIQNEYHEKNCTSTILKKICNNNLKNNSLNNLLKFELETEIPGAQTWRIDRTGSAHAVELREPFLDYRLVEFSLTIPPKLKINQVNGIKKKYILQKLGSKFLPKEIVYRKKFPWGIPFFDFFKKEFIGIAEEFLKKSLLNKNKFFNLESNYVIDMCKTVSNVSSYNSKDTEINDLLLRQILFLFNLELWNKMFVENDDFKNPNLSLDNYS